MNKVFNFYADPGHGWLACKKATLVELGIVSKITPYSYQRGDMAYLEEDGDLDLFFEAYQKKTGEKPILKPHHGDRRSKIRNYESYRCEAVFQVVASAYDIQTNEGQNQPLRWTTDSREAAIRQAEFWAGMGYWSAVYDKAQAGEAIHSVKPK